MRSRVLVLSFVLAALIDLMGCTRNAGPTSTLSFRLQNHAGQLAATGSDEISNVFVNVTGSGMTPILFQCDNHSGSRKACHPNADGSIDLSFQVDRGSGRLVQALVVYEDGTTHTNKFKYGAATTDTTNDSSLDIALADAGGGTTQGHVYGRYMNGSPTGGPSGLLEGRFIAPDNREMTVLRSVMVAGWFQLMLFDNASINYYVNDPQPQLLFSNAKLSSPEFMVSSPQVVRINVPPYDRLNGSGPETEGPQKIIVGFFGSAAASSGALACYDNRSAVAIPNAFQVGTQTALNYNGVSGTAGVDVIHEAGGQDFNLVAPVGQCADESKHFLDHIIFDETQLRNGHDSVAGFRGPFRMMDPSMSAYATAFYDSVAQKLTVSWGLLPDTPKYITGLQLFMRNVSVATAANSNDIYSDSGVDCPAVAGDASLGFRSIGDFSVTPAQPNGSLIASGIQSIANVQFVLCPYVGSPKAYLPAGVEVRPNMMVPLDMKLVGSDLSNSMIDGPGLGGTHYTFLKSSLTDIFHTFIVQAGQHRFAKEDVESVSYSVDDGTTWTDFLPTSVVNASYSSGPNTAIVLVGSDSGFTAAVAGGLDVDIKLKAKITSTAKTLYGVSNDTYISGPITLLGSNNCPSPGSIEAYDPIRDGTLVSTSDIFNGTGIVNNLSDVTIKLRWSSCPLASEPIDYVRISGMSTTPANCFSRADFVTDPSDPLAIHLSPVDNIVSGCTISSGTLDFVAPSNTGANAKSFFLDALSIPHAP